MDHDTRQDDATQQTPEPVRIIGPVERALSMPEAGLLVIACPYGAPGQHCYECPLVIDLQCLVRTMIASPDTETRATVARLLGGSA